MELDKETAYVPKNIKQIGEPPRERKIYVEDYVITYINRIFAGDKGTEKVLLLFGGEAAERGCTYIYIRGACQVYSEGNGTKGKYFSGEDFQNAMEEGRKYFKNLPLIGWALIRKGQPMSLEERMRSTWEAYMSRIPIFLLGDAAEREEIFYWKYDGRVKVQPGYYVFYEKNRAMQEYMVERKSEGKPLEEKEKEEDFLVDSLRERLEERKTQEKNRTGKMLYIASGFLFLVVLAIGITLLNSNEKISAIQASMDMLLESLAERETRQLETKKGTDSAALLGREEQEVTAGTAAREIVTSQTRATETTSAAEEATAEETAAEAAEAAGETVAEGNSKEVTASEQTDEETTTAATETTGASGPAQEAAARKPVSHVVGKGETLQSISRSIYGTTGMVDEICRKNNITNPDAIYAGQEILLP